MLRVVSNVVCPDFGEYVYTIRVDNQNRGLNDLCSFGHGLEKDAVIIYFFKAAAPNQFPVMDCNIRTAVTHILSSVRFKIDRLDDHKTL
jgi:hypothetical protein